MPPVTGHDIAVSAITLMNEFKFSCGKCGQHLKADADCVNLVIACPTCGATIRIPDPAAGTADQLPVAFESRVAPAGGSAAKPLEG